MFTKNVQSNSNKLNAWLTRSPELSHFLDLAYQNQHGEIWLYNNDLHMLRSPATYNGLYKSRICGSLSENVDAVRFLLSKPAEAILHSSPMDSDLREHLSDIARQSGGVARLSTFYFGSMEGSDMLPKATIPNFNQDDLPDGDTWIFYTHDRYIEAPNAGVVMVRPTRFPFDGGDHRFSVVWLLQSDEVLQDRLRKAFQECFRKSSNFKWMKVTSVEPFEFKLMPGESAETLKRRSNRSKSQNPEVLMPGDTVDVAVITALPEEMRELEKLLKTDLRATPMDVDSYKYTSIRQKKGFRKVLLATANVMGSTASAVITWDVIERWRPKFVILTGVAAGDPSREAKGLSLGDVIIAEFVVPYEHQKLDCKGEEWARAPITQATGQLFNAANRVAMENWPREVKGAPDNNYIESKVHVAAIASGNKLVENRNMWRRIRDMHDKIYALEMEGEGVVYASSTHRHRPESLVVKSIMDYATTRSRYEKEKWKPFASKVAAEFVVELLNSEDLS